MDFILYEIHFSVKYLSTILNGYAFTKFFVVTLKSTKVR